MIRNWRRLIGETNKRFKRSEISSTMLRLMLAISFISIRANSVEFNSSIFGDAPSQTTDSAESKTLDSTCACISLHKCAKLFEIFQKHKNITRIERETLLRSLCGWSQEIPLVCCDGNANTVKRVVRTADNQCGRISAEVNSSKVDRTVRPGAWPWLTALYVQNVQTEMFQYVCSGTLISKEWVLTAAHCVPPSREHNLIKVRLGDLDLNSTIEDEATPIEVSIKTIIKHPQYSRNSLILNDIALLQLNESVEYTKYIRPICLDSGEEYLNYTLYANKKASLAGWSTSYHYEATDLLEDAINVVPNSVCVQHHEEYIHVKIDKTVICARTPGQDYCRATFSGGPLMFQKQGNGEVWSQSGILSLDNECDSHTPGIYTKIGSFIDWITSTTGLKF